MQTLANKLTSKEVMQQVDNLDHLFWSPEMSLKAQAALQNGIEICDIVMADMPENDVAGYAYFRNSKYELIQTLNCLKKENTPNDFIERENPMVKPKTFQGFDGRIEPKNPYPQSGSELLLTDDTSPNYGWLAFVVLSVLAFCAMLYKES